LKTIQWKGKKKQRKLMTSRANKMHGRFCCQLATEVIILNQTGEATRDRGVAVDNEEEA